MPGTLDYDLLVGLTMLVVMERSAHSEGGSEFWTSINGLQCLPVE